MYFFKINYQHITNDFTINEKDNENKGKKRFNNKEDHIIIGGPDNIQPSDWKTNYQYGINGEKACLDKKKSNGKQHNIPQYLFNNKNRFEPIEMNDNVKSKIDNTTQSKQPSIL